jgi:hypothetical protein
VPSTPQPEPPVGVVHVPGFVAETALAFGDWQTPPQQSAPAKQMSPFWMQ